MRSHSDGLVLVLALCGLACAIPPSPHQPTPCAQPDDAIVVVSDPSESPDHEVSADVEACTSYCSELGSTCPGTLSGGKPCLEACIAWPEAALDCREDWLANGSCIGAALDSPPCEI